MMAPDFVYVTYIRATPDKIFRALTTSEFTRQYWRHDMVSDWKKGSSWTSIPVEGQSTDNVGGKVLECDPPRRLAYSWSRKSDAADPANVSRVVFDVEQFGDMTRLTVTHDQLAAGSYMDSRIRQGWPRVLASLKTLLETGDPLDTWSSKEIACA